MSASRKPPRALVHTRITRTDTVMPPVRPPALIALAALLLSSACDGTDVEEMQEPAAAADDSIAPGMVTGTTGAPGPGTVGTPGTPAATDPDTIPETEPAAGL